MLWTEEELKAINEYMKEAFEMDEDVKPHSQAIDFMGCCLGKLGENKYGLLEWDYDRHEYSYSDTWFTGTLKECCDKIIAVS